MFVYTTRLQVVCCFCLSYLLLFFYDLISDSELGLKHTKELKNKDECELNFLAAVGCLMQKNFAKCVQFNNLSILHYMHVECTESI